MNPELGLRVLGSIMAWDDDRALDEFQRLRLMASLKYDGYRDFEAGVRFIERLASWLQQFRPEHRENAYRFVMERLVYIGPSEMAKLVAQFYTNTVHPELASAVAHALGIPRYLLPANAEARARFVDLRRRTLFLGLSDGARVDYIRHQHVGLLSNEQVVGSTQLDAEKWSDLLQELRKDVGDGGARFRAVYLIDDFVGTGSSFHRIDSDSGAPKGKLSKFAKSVASAEASLGKIFEDNYQLIVHHYIGTAQAVESLGDRLATAHTGLPALHLQSAPRASYGLKLPATLRLDDARELDRAFLEISEEYYDHSIHTQHTKVGGTTDMKRGYGGCALPVVLDHNTPNNSMPLLWAETAGAPDASGVAPHAMRPLFRRRQRHT
jgi:hypothetical protein